MTTPLGEIINKPYNSDDLINVNTTNVTKILNADWIKID